VDAVLARVANRWRGLDELLPVPQPPAAGEDMLADASGVAALIQRAPEPGAPEPMWFAAHRFTLRPLLAGPDIGGGLDRLLGRWRERIARVARAAGADSAAYVTVPARDVETFPALVRHGLTPYVVIAARRPGAPGGGPDAPADIRQVGSGDLDVLVDLALRQSRHEIPFGTAYDRDTAPEQVRAELERLLDVPERWVWLAESGDRPVGLLTATPPAEAEWLAPYTDARPLAYLSLAYVEPDARGAGMGAALAAAAHRAFDGAGVGLTLLHYSVLNPRSGPFWHRLGYRPLWTGWQARPASALR